MDDRLGRRDAIKNQSIRCGGSACGSGCSGADRLIDQQMDRNYFDT